MEEANTSCRKLQKKKDDNDVETEWVTHKKSQYCEKHGTCHCTSNVVYTGRSVKYVYRRNPLCTTLGRAKITEGSNEIEFLNNSDTKYKTADGTFAMLEKDHVIQVGRDSRLDNIEFDSIDVGTLYVITKVVENKDNTFEVDKPIMGRKEIGSAMSENVQIGLCARRNSAGRFDFIPNYDFQKLRLSEDKQYYFRVQTVSSINKEYGPLDINGEFVYKDLFKAADKKTIYGEKFELHFQRQLERFLLACWHPAKSKN